ncbi:hypothetical protein JAB5_02910 [Janthinobacterium sp. HH103]|uniref:hypothetical protein n=1 Tax=unclassified Janthinobacterium TaxID=2610881 RepID=UPI0008934A19|nr:MULTISPECIES: hypothetical protein [unclassified Janthinobacterium]OEZ67352.1 hypothetical protein JAB2_24140 [Janthinobacterium sp. HH100]OEZ87500.1 hypothetical protein JAB5_02910 [Janthinobacterium sp. HH103]QOU72050.1 hypothetical protein JAB4_014740 [Janthinobacterium sp. HH102]
MRAKKTMALAGLLCTLAACNSNPNNTGMSSTNGRSGESYSNTAGTGSTSTGTGTGTSTSSTMSNAGTGSADTRTSSANNAMNMDGSQTGVSIASATVQSIEPVPRGMDQRSGDMQSGSSGTAGSTSGNTQYRVTLRLDDGSTQTLMQNSQPSYQIGDHVKVVNGLLQRY